MSRLQPQREQIVRQSRRSSRKSHSATVPIHHNHFQVSTGVLSLLPGWYHASLSLPSLDSARESMCVQTYERYAECGCPYYKHAIDPCSKCDREGHTVSVRIIDVGYKCREHDRSRSSQRKSSTDGEEATLPNIMSQGSTISGPLETVPTTFSDLQSQTSSAVKRRSCGSEADEQRSLNSEPCKDKSMYKIHLWPHDGNRVPVSAGEVAPPSASDVSTADVIAAEFPPSITDFHKWSMTDVFQYTALPKDHTRVLTFSDTPNTISCTLEAFPDEKLPPFSALSYEWGNEAPTVSILCNGKIFHVTRHLYSALRTIFRLGCAPKLWVDAICLNQRDKEEKSIHIPKLATIYQTANNILAWSTTGRLRVLAIDACPADAASLRAWAWSDLGPYVELAVRKSGHLPPLDAINDILNKYIWIHRVCLVCGKLRETKTFTNRAWYLHNLEGPLCESCGFCLLTDSSPLSIASRKGRIRRESGFHLLTGVQVKELNTIVAAALTCDLNLKFVTGQSMAAPGIQHWQVGNNEEQSVALFAHGSERTSRFPADLEVPVEWAVTSILENSFDRGDRRTRFLLDTLRSEKQIDLFPLHEMTISQHSYPWIGSDLGNLNRTVVRPADIYTNGWFFRTKCPFCDVWFADITFLAFWESRMNHVSQHFPHAKGLHASRYHQVLWHARLIRHDGARPYLGNTIGNYPRILKSGNSKRPRISDRASDRSDALSADPGPVGQRLRLVTQPSSTSSPSMGSASKAFEGSPNSLDGGASARYKVQRLLEKSCQDMLLHYILPLIRFVGALPLTEATLAVVRLRPRRTRTISWTCVSYTLRDPSKAYGFRASCSVTWFPSLFIVW